MKKIAIGLLGLALATPAFSQTATTEVQPPATTPGTETTSTVEQSAIWNRIKESSFHLSLDTETFTTRKDGETEISGSLNNLYPTASYDFTSASNLALYPKIVFNSDGLDYDGYMENLALRYTQKDLLTEEKHGVSFSADARYYATTHEGTRTTQGSDGHFNTRTYLTHKFNDKFSLYNHNRFSVYNRNHNSHAKSDTIYGRVDLQPKYKVTESFSTGTTFQYLGNQYTDFVSKEEVYAVPFVSYDVTEKFNTLFEVYLPLARNRDNGTNKPGKDILAAPAVSYSLNDQFSFIFTLYVPVLDDAGKLEGKYTRDHLEAELDLTLVAF